MVYSHSRLSRLNCLDDLRAVAALLVFACHASLFWLGRHGRTPDLGLDYLGRFGVAIFFVISGLVIYRPFVEIRRSGRNLDLWAYAVRRVLRIAPAYWIALAFFVVLLPQQVQPVGSEYFGLFAGFGQIYSPINYYRGLSVAWTLDVELCFYAAAPIIALGVQSLIARGHTRRLEGLVLLCLGLISIAVRAFSPDGVLGGTILGYTGWFAIGMAVAVVVAQPTPLLRRIRLPSSCLWALAGAGYLLLTAHLAPPPHPTQGTLLEYCGLGLLAALIVLTAINASGNNATPVGKWLGDRSYGVYLWHYPILAWLAGKNVSGWHYLAEALGLTLVAAHLSFLLLERPLMRRAASFGRQRLAADSARPPALSRERAILDVPLAVTHTG